MNLHRLEWIWMIIYTESFSEYVWMFPVYFWPEGNIKHFGILHENSPMRRGEGGLFPPCHPQSMAVGHGRPPPRPAARVRPARKISILNPEGESRFPSQSYIVLTSTNGIQQNGRWIRGVPVWMWGATLPWAKSRSTHDVISRSLENRFWTDF